MVGERERGNEDKETDKEWRVERRREETKARNWR